MDFLKDFLSNPENRFIIGLCVAWWGVGVLCVSIAWGIAKHREKKMLEGIEGHILNFVRENVGHMVEVHATVKDGSILHAHCLCGERSLDYKVDDPTGAEKMELWADEHINALMESSGR